MTEQERRDTLRIDCICLAGMRNSMPLLPRMSDESVRTLQRSGMNDSALDENIMRLNVEIYELDNRVIDSILSLIWR